MTLTAPTGTHIPAPSRRRGARSRLRAVIGHLVGSVLLVLAVSAVVFALTSLMPGDPARQILGIRATAAQVARKRLELGLDLPLPQRYLDWLSSAVRGDLGTSWFSNLPVIESLSTHLPVTLALTGIGVAVTLVVGVGAGLLAAARPGRLDDTLQTAVTIGGVLPNFVVGIGLVLLFAIQWRLFPATGYVVFLDDPAGWARSLALPVTALALGAAAAVAQQTRVSAAAELDQRYVLTLRARGISTGSLYVRHVLRNAAPGILAVVSLQFIGLLSGSVVIESVFSLPGLGTLVTEASIQQDTPVLLGVTITLVLIIVIVNLLADLLQRLLDVRTGSRA